MNNTIRSIQNIHGQEVPLTPFEADYQNRILIIDGEIDTRKAILINSALRNLARLSEDDIILYIQSTGGSVADGFTIYDTIKAISCDVCTVACGLAASMAAVLVAAGTKGKRYILPNSEMLIHQPLGNMQGQATDIRIQAEHMELIRSKVVAALASCSSQSTEKIKMDTERDYILDSQQAVAYGLVDRIGDPFMEDE